MSFLTYILIYHVMVSFDYQCNLLISIYYMFINLMIIYTFVRWERGPLSPYLTIRIGQ